MAREYTEQEEIDHVESMISACGSASDMYDAAKMIRYQINARPKERLDDLQEAYETARRYCGQWAGVEQDLIEKHFDKIINRELAGG